MGEESTVTLNDRVWTVAPPVLIIKDTPEGQIPFVVCPACGYEYSRRVDKPKRCPACQKDLTDWRPEPTE